MAWSQEKKPLRGGKDISAFSSKKSQPRARHWWLTLVILATQAEIRRIDGLKPAQQIVCETLSQKNPSQKKIGLVEWCKVKALSSIPSTEKKKKSYSPEIQRSGV
jgi:hypothetical protein